MYIDVKYRNQRYWTIDKQNMILTAVILIRLLQVKGESQKKKIVEKWLTEEDN